MLQQVEGFRRHSYQLKPNNVQKHLKIEFIYKKSIYKKNFKKKFLKFCNNDKIYLNCNIVLPGASFIWMVLIMPFESMINVPRRAAPYKSSSSS
jgi:hypothetical protein